MHRAPDNFDIDRTPNSPPAGTVVAMWRLAEPGDDDSLVEMCLRLYDEDPGILPIHPENMRATLRALRREPSRGRAVVLEVENQLSGYALLIAFWSNELGGNICEVDELFVVPQRRNLGHGKSLFEAISSALSRSDPVAVIRSDPCLERNLKADLDPGPSSTPRRRCRFW